MDLNAISAEEIMKKQNRISATKPFSTLVDHFLLHKTYLKVCTDFSVTPCIYFVLRCVICTRIHVLPRIGEARRSAG